MKKKKIVLFVFLLIGVLSLVFTYNKKMNLNKNKLLNKSYAIYVKENNSSIYTNSKSIPKGSYILNKEKSFCENNGEISSYDNVNGVVGFSFIGSDRCTLYFEKDSIAPTITNLTVNETILTATLSDNNILVGYGLSTNSNVEPTNWTQINGITYNLNITVESEGIYYLWVKDSAGNKAIKEFTISLGTSFTTLMTPNNTDIFDENGIRYEGANPNNYICLDNQKEGTCSNTSLLFRIIGLFDEEYSTDGTNSSGTKKLLKVIDTNNYGGTSGKYWNSTGLNNWNTASLKTELNGTYLTTLLGTSNVNSKLSSGVANAKWYLGGASTSNRSELTAEGIYTEERNPSAIYSGNPSSIYAKVGLMYPSDYGYATVGGSTTNKTGCRSEPLYDWNRYQDSTNSDCKDNDWLFISQISFVNNGEFLISPFSSMGSVVAVLMSPGFVHLMMADSASYRQFAVRPTFYLDSDAIKIVGGDGTQTSPYHIG